MRVRGKKCQDGSAYQLSGFLSLQSDNGHADMGTPMFGNARSFNLASVK